MAQKGCGDDTLLLTLFPLSCAAVGGIPRGHPSQHARQKLFADWRHTQRRVVMNSGGLRNLVDPNINNDTAAVYDPQVALLLQPGSNDYKRHDTAVSRLCQALRFF